MIDDPPGADPHCRELADPRSPSLMSTGYPLASGHPIAGRLNGGEASVLSLACQLHPTRPVCGYPTDLGRQFIREQEPFRRALFHGGHRWLVRQPGNGEWAVVIRCGVPDGHQVELFAGAGIVAGSDPAMEWAETGTKLGTMLKAWAWIWRWRNDRSAMSLGFNRFLVPYTRAGRRIGFQPTAGLGPALARRAVALPCWASVRTGPRRRGHSAASAASVIVELDAASSRLAKSGPPRLGWGYRTGAAPQRGLSFIWCSSPCSKAGIAPVNALFSHNRLELLLCRADHRASLSAR